MQDNWIKVEDKKPDMSSDKMDWSVDVFVKNGKRKLRAYYDFFLQKWFWIKKDGTSSVIFPTYWQSLPEPPKPSQP